MSKSQAEQMIGKPVLVTTDAWFVAPDGKQYQAIYGNLAGVFGDTDITGLKTNARSTNWYIQVGRQIVAGCQVHYISNCEDVEVNLGKVDNWVNHEGKVVISKTPSRIYNADFAEEK